MATAKSKALRIHNTIKVDTRKSLPVMLGGDDFTSISGYQYHPFFAPNDNFFQTLLEAYLLSPTLARCIRDKALYVVGSGLQVQDKEFPKTFDRHINYKRQTIDDIIKLIAGTVYRDGNKFIEITRSEFEGERFVHVHPHNNLDCRLEKRKDGQDATHVVISKSFRTSGMYSWEKRNEVNRIPLWQDMPGADCWTKGKVQRTIIQIKDEVDGIDNYGLPSYYPGMLNVLMEHRATSFNLDNFDNNMFLAGILFMSGSMTPAEEKKFLNNLKKMYTGEGKGQRVLPVSAEGGLQDTKFVPFNNKQEGHFMELDDHNSNKIILISDWSKHLLDMNESSGLGKGGEYLVDLFKIKFNTVIIPMQQMLLNNFIFPLMKIIDEWKNTKFYDMPWILQPVIPVSLQGKLTVDSLLTVDEGREELGKKPLAGEKGKMLISEVKPKMDPKQDAKKKKEEEK